MRTIHLYLLLVLFGVSAVPASAEAPTFLEQMDQAITDLVARVSPSIVYAKWSTSPFADFATRQINPSSLTALRMEAWGSRAPRATAEVPGVGLISFAPTSGAQPSPQRWTSTGVVIDDVGHVLFYAGQLYVPAKGTPVTVILPDGRTVETTVLSSQAASGTVVVRLPEPGVPSLRLADADAAIPGSLVLALARLDFHISSIMRYSSSGSQAPTSVSSDAPPLGLLLSFGTVMRRPTATPVPGSLRLNLPVGQEYGGAVVLSASGELLGFVTGAEVAGNIGMGTSVSPPPRSGPTALTTRGTAPPEPPAVAPSAAPSPTPEPTPRRGSAPTLPHYTFRVIPPVPAAFPTAQAYPITAIKPLLPAMVTGAPVYGWLGLSARNLTDEEGKARGVPVHRAYLVTEVFPEGPAAQAGILPGDLIVRPEGDAVFSPRFSLEEILQGTAPGEVLSLTLDRDDTLYQADITLQLSPEAQQYLPEPFVASAVVPLRPLAPPPPPMQDQ